MGKWRRRRSVVAEPVGPRDSCGGVAVHGVADLAMTMWHEPLTREGDMHKKWTSEEALAYLHHHGACVEYYPDFLCPRDVERYKHCLLATVEFNAAEASKVRRPFSRDKIAIPRCQTAYGDAATCYRFAGCTVPARPWIPILVELREVLSTRTGYQPNFVLLNYYRSGRDYIGWHADDERDLGEAPTILSLSLGAERELQFRHRDAFPQAGHPARRPDVQTVSLLLRSGSLLIMKDPTNNDWKHQLPRRGGTQAATLGERLNLTWRRIVNRGL